MAIPDTSTLIKQLLARTLVIGAMSYFFLDGNVSPNNVMEHMKVGLVGASGSVISICYVETM